MASGVTFVATEHGLGYNTHTAVDGSCGKTPVAIMLPALRPCHHTRGVLLHVLELYRSRSRTQST